MLPRFQGAGWNGGRGGGRYGLRTAGRKSGRTTAATDGSTTTTAVAAAAGAAGAATCRWKGDRKFGKPKALVEKLLAWAGLKGLKKRADTFKVPRDDAASADAPSAPIVISKAAKA